MRKLSVSIGSFLAALVLFTSCDKEVTTANYEVIPMPNSIEAKMGAAFALSNSTSISYPKGNEDLQRTANFLADYLKYSTGMTLKVTDEVLAEDVIALSADFKHDNKEAYNLQVEAKKISIDGVTAQGAFYGVQTLRKSIDADSDGKIVMLPQVNIVDYPRFSYRGMMLDVGRHFFPLDFIKEYIDILALHNINTFHWHLSEDQGWRIEIKKYPKLTEIGSQRKETVIGRNTGEFDGKPYGGFYTQEEAKEIVAYAKDRFITVIPEIDLPGHMLAALTAYPELGCTGGPYEVERTWGVFDDVLCVGNDKTMEFLKDVFSEIIEIFPSEYIHVGGDECPKVKWKTCPKCQAKIKALGLKADKAHSAEDRLQSYCISTVEKFLNEKGRQIIGWDEILEGGLAPNATVMSWRGIEGGIQAAKEKHNVVMTPTSHLYFDYYQTANVTDEPLSIGGFVPLDKVYGFDPVPSVLTEDEKKYIIGVQANLWTEYLPTTERVEYQVLPRMDALAEIQWTEIANKDYNRFLKSLSRQLKHYKKKGYNYSPRVFDANVKVTTNPEAKAIEVSISTVDDAPVYYTLDGTEPTDKSTKYEGAIQIKEACTLKATPIRSSMKAPVYTQDFKINKATMKPITLNHEPRGQYAFNGKTTLVDGIAGNKGGYKDGTWIGFNREEGVEALIDMQGETEFSTVKVGTYVCTGDWIFGATGLTVWTSEDGKEFKEVGHNSYFEATKHKEGYESVEVKLKEPAKAKFVKVYIAKTRKLPEWHAGKGAPAYIFLDEIEIN